MKRKTILYQYTIYTDGEKSYCCEKGFRTPICQIVGDAEQKPQLSAKLLRKLAVWANEQAEIIDELENSEQRHAEYMAAIDKQDKIGEIVPLF